MQEWMEEERCRMEQDRAQRRAYRARMEMLAAYSFEGGVRYASLNMAVPPLRRYFAGEDTRPDFRLSRASITSLLQLLNQERCHGWGPTIEVLVLLFWLASDTSYLDPQALECAQEAHFQSQYTQQIFIVRNCELLYQQLRRTRGAEGIRHAQDHGAQRCPSGLWLCSRGDAKGHQVAFHCRGAERSIRGFCPTG
ncbi:uncharacterized protein LOC124478954 isoform X2 [Hypomesus transpacificus]|nr:uncharacterized protein LOC124478954 isoform X2 [Hypomesus transpacificus]